MTNPVPMHVTIDVATGTLSLTGGAATSELIRFDLDCRDGSASVDLDGHAFILHPLAWREKNNLARFAHLGNAFVARQLVRLSLGEVASRDVDERSVAALSALAQWLNAPDAESALPLEQSSLAIATVEVCRGLHLGPADLDARPAAEVEALWRVVAGSEGAVETADEQASTSNARSNRTPDRVASHTRIVIVPDAPNPSPDGGVGVDEPDAAQDGGSFVSPPEPTDEHAPRPAGRAAPGQPKRPLQITQARRTSASAPRTAGSFRVVAAAPILTHVPRPAPVLFEAPLVESTTGTAEDAWVDAQATIDVPPTPAGPEPEAPHSLSAAERDMLFEELAEQLERASLELGIALGD